MSPTNDNVMAKKYSHKNKEEWDEFKEDLCSILHLKKNKLDVVMVKGSLHSSIIRRETKDSGIDVTAGDPTAQADARQKLQDHLELILAECDEEVYHIIHLNISDSTLKQTIAREYGKDKYGHKAFIHIEAHGP